MKLLLQIAVLLGICLVGEGLSSLLPFPFPASVISMILLFVLLAVGWLRVEHIRQKADFLLKNMAFFFVPSGVGLMEHFEVVGQNLLPLLVICTVSTFLTFGATALTVKLVNRLQNSRRRER